MKIQQDIHGIFVRTGGHLFRPDKAKYSYYHSKLVNKSSFKKGQEVKARHVSQTPFAKISDGGIEEYWNSHGENYKFDKETKTVKKVRSELLWNPK